MSRPGSEQGAAANPRHERAPRLRESKHDPQLSDAMLTVDLGGRMDEGAYLVVPLSELVTQFVLAFSDTDVKGGKHRPQRALARMLMVMNDLGHVHHPDADGRIVHRG